MKSFTPTVLFALMAHLIHAAPGIEMRQSTQWAEIVFEGAPPVAAQFTLWEPIDGSEFPISVSFPQVFMVQPQLIHLDNPLSISHIQVYGQAACGFVGVDGSRTWVTDGETIDVGSPQTQTFGFCWPYWRE